MKDLEATSAHYIRCIKSNPRNSPLKVHWREVLRQLKYAGVQQVIAIRQHGFLYKVPYEQFARRYRPVLVFDDLQVPAI